MNDLTRNAKVSVNSTYDDKMPDNRLIGVRGTVLALFGSYVKVILEDRPINRDFYLFRASELDLLPS